MTKKAYEAIKTTADLKADLRVLKKRLAEKKREEIMKPFIPMILEGHKVGKLALLMEAFSRVIYGDNNPKKMTKFIRETICNYSE